MIRLVLLIPLVAMLAGCHQAVNPPAQRLDSRATALDSSEWRQFVGQWDVAFYLDFTQTSEVTAPQRASGRSARGSLLLTDSLVPPYGLRTVWSIDFRDLLGRPISCLEAARFTGITQVGGDFALQFTPTASDCGFSATVTPGGDSLSGTWREYAFTGVPASGRFWMRRHH